MTSLTLRLIRHPKPQVQSGICYGASDLPAQAQALEDFVRACAQLTRPDAVLTSPLQRCSVPSKRLTAHDWPEPWVLNDLREMSFGQWEMQPWSQTDRTQIDAWAADIAHYVPPEGESLSQVAARSSQAIEHWLEHNAVAHATVAVVCHSGVIQALMHRFSGDAWQVFKPKNLAYAVMVDIRLTRDATDQTWRALSISAPVEVQHLASF